MRYIFSLLVTLFIMSAAPSSAAVAIHYQATGYGVSNRLYLSGPTQTTFDAKVIIDLYVTVEQGPFSTITCDWNCYAMSSVWDGTSTVYISQNDSTGKFTNFGLNLRFSDASTWSTDESAFTGGSFSGRIISPSAIDQLSVTITSLTIQSAPAQTSSRSGSTFVTVAPAPEPAVWLMMLVGFGAVGASLRKHAPSRFRYLQL